MNFEGTKLLESFLFVTNVPEKIGISLLKFIYKYNGHIGGSCAVAMYLYSKNIRTFEINDIDIYIPSKESFQPHSYRNPAGNGNDVTFLINNKRNPLTRNIFNDPRPDIEGVDIYDNTSYWNDITRDFSSYFNLIANFYERSDKGTILNYDSPTIENDTEIPLPWTRIVEYKRTNEFTPAAWGRHNANTIYATHRFNKQSIQLIFYKHNQETIKNYVNRNYDFTACKVYTTLDINNPFEVTDKIYTENKILDIPNNWKSISLLACFRTVTMRYIKYLKRGFYPATFKTRNSINLKKIGKVEIDIDKSIQIMNKLFLIYVYKKIINLIDRSVYIDEDLCMYQSGVIYGEVESCKQIIRNAEFFQNMINNHLDKKGLNFEIFSRAKTILIEFMDKIELLNRITHRFLINKNYDYFLNDDRYFYGMTFNKNTFNRNEYIQGLRDDIQKLDSIKENEIDRIDKLFSELYLKPTKSIKITFPKYKQLYTKNPKKTYKPPSSLKLKKKIANQSPKNNEKQDIESIPARPVRLIKEFLPAYGGK